MQRFGKKQRAFIAKVKRYYYLAQLPMLIILLILTEFDIKALITLFLLVSYFCFAQYYWNKHAHPEIPFTKSMMLFLIRPGFIWQIVCVLCFVPSLCLLILQLSYFVSIGEALPHFKILVCIILFFATCITLYGHCFKPVKIRERIIPIDKRYPSIDGLRIAHLSDWHFGNLTSQRDTERWVQSINDLQLDIAVFTGDLITFGDAFIEKAIRYLAKIKTKYGVYFSLGNHEYFVNDVTQLINTLKRYNIHTLLDDSIRIELPHLVLQLSGIDGVVDNLDLQKAHLKAALTKTESHLPIILLAHDPSIFTVVNASHILLVLSGHTHAGQIALPFREDKNLAMRRYHYNHGLYKKGMSHLHVSPGMGTSILPFRFGTSPEISILTFSTQENHSC